MGNVSAIPTVEVHIVKVWSVKFQNNLRVKITLNREDIRHLKLNAGESVNVFPAMTSTGFPRTRGHQSMFALTRMMGWGDEFNCTTDSETSCDAMGEKAFASSHGAAEQRKEEVHVSWRFE